MNITLADKRQGNVILLCLFTAAAIALVLVSYLQLGNSHESFVARSQSWNLALPAAEAGIEEGMTHLNYVLENDLACNGWTKQGGNYVKTRALSTDAYYSVTLDKSGKTATLTSTGFIRAPSSTNYISRIVEVAANRTNVTFAKALVARKHIKADKGSLIDSFDSSDNKYSASGKYVFSKHKDTASIAANENNKDAIKISKTKVYGDAATGPKGSVKVDGGGSLGNSAWVDGGKTGADPTKVSSTFSYNFPEVLEPWKKGTGGAPSGGTYNKVSYQYILGNGNHELGKVDLKQPMVVKSNTTATLYVTGDFKASSDIVIEKGATLKLYMAGHKFEVKDKDVELNSGDASQFQYYGLPSNKDVRFHKKGDSDFTGVIYAPDAKIMMDGGGDTIGSIVGRCIHLQHSGAFHYDEAINTKSLALDMYVIKSWQEK